MPRSRIKPEYTVRLSNAVAVYINQIGNMEGEKCFLITDVAGKFSSFVLTADALPLADDVLTKKQEQIAMQLKHKIAEIIKG